eukprot:CAMPEP_0173290490 /NCGR_PEP_ID=MMETSP1143-20121109/11591_1 /TAXON_ID=483371 /ORGANISM="non described non described, Strain CCMP2298" /LENGTH=228 /DNA_ID=CAMNT_0014229551 /DNA_START=212 /DNA_END=898 /DNA_ORIENTATION=-
MHLSMIYNQHNGVPKTPAEAQRLQARSLSALPLLAGVLLNSRPSAAAVATEGPYVDKVNKFSLSVRPSWLVMPRKAPAPRMMQYQVEEVLFVANSFAEGASLGVTKTNALRLLKDFEVEWWFAPLNSLADLGSAELVARLLILQRQGEFDTKITPSQITRAEFKKSPQECLDFDFETPIVEGVNRRTLARGFFRDGQLYVLWISGLSSVLEGEYAVTLTEVLDSFKLI